MFMVIHEKVQKQIKAIMTDWCRRGARLTPAQKQARDLYRVYVSKDRLTAAGSQTLVQVLDDLIIGLDKTNLAGRLGRLNRLGLPGIWDFSVEHNGHDNQSFIFWLGQSGLTLPGRDYYTDRQLKKSHHGSYRQFIKSFWGSVAKTVDDKRLGRYRRQFATKIIDLEAKLAAIHWDHTQNQDDIAIQQVLSRDQLKERYPFAWEDYFAAVGLKSIPDQLIVNQPSFLGQVLALIDASDSRDLAVLLTWQLLVKFGPGLSEDLSEQSFAFFGRQLHGQKQPQPLTKRARYFVGSVLTDTIGREYVRRHFPKSHQADVERLAAEIKASFRRRLLAVDWLTPKTKKLVLLKLRRIQVNLGRPQQWANYRGLKIDSGNLIQTFLDVSEFLTDRSLNLLGRQPNRANFDQIGSGVYSAQVVNAWTNPNMLTTNYPAAILQPPFYDHQASWATNLGSLGTVIGHELTHHFDTRGGQYDHNGNLKPWLTKSERTKFVQASQPLIDQADNYVVVGSVRLRGKQVISEHLADIGGLLIATDLVARRWPKDEVSRRRAYIELFQAFAYRQARNMTDEALIRVTKTDEHPDSPFRVNGVVVHADAFYDAYNLTPKDKLYLKPSARASVW